MLGEQEAILIRPPAGAGTGETCSPTKTSFTSASTAAVPTGSFGASVAGVWMTFIATQACHIRFGDVNVAAATSSDEPIGAWERVHYWCSNKDATHFRVIRDTADGDLYSRRS
jgi:hypothetical protein